ncbi:MAG: cell division protein FtsA [Patescibacteria group bacterium]|jgi:cell division protein FtsA|nr:cell division protein FtsA [Patescibacteria group bacterium]MDD5172951.1 cell division protein FtsA [Patescibacteria group bacterium]
MSRLPIITGIDLGSSTIRIAVGEIRPEGDLHITGLGEGPSEGISKGVVTSIEDTVSSISACVEQVERMTGNSIETAYIGISGSHIISQESRGVVAISGADGEIKHEDVERVLEAAEKVATPANYEIIHVLPRNFSVDNQVGIIDPVGMTGVRLEVEAQIILGLANQIKNLNKCLYRVGIDAKEIVFTALSTAEAVLNKRQKDLGVLVLNIGSTTTSFAVFEEGDVLTAKVLPIGARHITNDIAIGLRIPVDLAEIIKINYGTSLIEKASKNKIINFKDLDEKESGTVSQKEVAKIIEARCEEIFKMTDKELIHVDRNGKLPAGVVLTGAGAKLDGLTETAKKIFKMPASLGVPQGFVSGINKAFDPSFSTAVGLVLWGQKSVGKNSKFISKLKIGSKIKKIFKNLMPY